MVEIFKNLKYNRAQTFKNETQLVWRHLEVSEREKAFSKHCFTFFGTKFSREVKSTLPPENDNFALFGPLWESVYALLKVKRGFFGKFC